MKIVLTLLLLLSISSLHGQGLDSCGVDNKPRLNRYESELLNEYLKNHKGNFDFTNKNVVFVTGSSGSIIATKKSYFTNIKDWNKKNSRIATSLIVLSEEEKVESGGYDAMVTYWVKVLGSKRKVIKKIKQAANHT
ncbi:hypothetical protein AHMF7605_21100 [Adhaeribacter arboris]|uniref:DUF8192 domain-containing protein n=1 Tax=Adhaeribacter arboris TaxID=2072846 RepID=A0A2T2YJX5_9BACT|nr:hypothetical protein [Adhaeribacter arboris]PSR55816.1 hypothetical protein AHMF7605_21100 [Adhaeribacter arboris]